MLFRYVEITTASPLGPPAASHLRGSLASFHDFDKLFCGTSGRPGQGPALLERMTTPAALGNYFTFSRARGL